MNKVKVIVAAILAVLLVIVILQNTQQVETKLLFVAISMPRAVLLLTTLVVGFVIGLLAAGRLTRKSP
jgi:uncharacterized integral membrane protein